MANQTTMIADLVNPQVMADMISAKIPMKLVVAPFAKVDTTLAGRPGNTITVPQYAYIGDAEDIAEGIAAETVKLETSTAEVTVKKAMKAVELTDEAVLSGYGNPVGETNNQLAKAIASKVDSDAMEALQGAQLVYDGSASVIKYSGVVDAIDLFDEEINTEKVIFVHPKQVTQLRKDSDFISADKYTGVVDAIDMFDEEVNTEKVIFVHPKQVTQLRKDSDFISTDKYPGNVVMTGEIGKIANAHVVPSKKVKDDGTNYLCPIVKLNGDAETEDEAPALTIYLKRDTNVETDRVSLARKTDISVDKHYAVALSNTSKVVLAKFKK